MKGRGLRIWSLVVGFASVSVFAHAQSSSAPSDRSAGDEVQTLRWEIGPTGSRASLRGLFAVDDRVVWATGSQATVLLSVDGGSTWSECGPTGYRDLEFRAVHAWNAREACVASAGTPAVLLRTEDAGGSWQRVFEAHSTRAFFDGLKFWDAERGVAFSDPVDGRLLIVETEDGGRSWQPVKNDLLPVAAEGEAGFAASNSSLAIGAGGRVWIGTGGALQSNSRIYYRADWKSRWRVQTCPLPSGPAQGVFSLAVGPEQQMMAVGGDYRPEAKSPATAAYSADGGVHWTLPAQPPADYRSAVSFVGRPIRGWIAVGPTGSDFSADGQQWQRFSTDGFHTLAAGQNQLFAAGADGRFALLRIDLDPSER